MAFIARSAPAPGAVTVVGERALAGRDGHGVVVVVEDAAVGGRHVLRGADGVVGLRHEGRGHVGVLDREAGADAAVGAGGRHRHRARVGLVAGLGPAPGAVTVVGERALAGRDGHGVVVVVEDAAVGG